MKNTIKTIVAGRLANAPDSVAKAELVEELTENLFCRYTDLVNGGVEPDEARAQAVDALGDTDELVEYLKGLEPDQPLPQLVRDPDKEDDGQLEELLKNVEDIVKGAMKKARTTFGDVKEQLKDSGVWKSRDGKMEIHVNGKKVTDPEVAQEILDEVEADFAKAEEDFAKAEEEFAKAEEEFAKAEEDFEKTKAEADLKGMADDLMKDIKNLIRQSGHFAREAMSTASDAIREAAVEVKREVAPETGDAVDTTGPIEAARLRGIDVQSVGGEVTIVMSQDPDGDVLVGGDIEDLEVFRSDDGVLTIRPVRTETGSFFQGRGIFNSNTCADVELELPCRHWEFLKVATTGGDVELRGDAPVGEVSITTVSGDINGGLPSCGRLTCRTTNGDFSWVGDASDVRLESISGDMAFRGTADSLSLKTTSGDIRAEGALCGVSVKTVSGDVCVRSSVMPGRLDVGTTSGDMWVDIPDGEAFTARFRSTSGDFTSDFFAGSMSGRSCQFNYLGGGERTYGFATISGDLELRRFRG